MYNLAVHDVCCARRNDFKVLLKWRLGIVRELQFAAKKASAAAEPAAEPVAPKTAEELAEERDAQLQEELQVRGLDCLSYMMTCDVCCDVM